MLSILKPYIHIARPDHWIKQLFIIPGIVLAVYLCDTEINVTLMIRSLWGLLFTSLIASANYVINEWLDGQYDKYHPTKKNRPVVTEKMYAKYIYLEYAILAVLGLTGSYLILGKEFFLVNLWLLIMGILYNVKPFRTKDLPILDVLSESVNNAIRFLLGWFIVTGEFFPPSSILIGYWMAGTYLMDIKRFAEYRMIGDPELAAKYRKSFAFYDEIKLLVLAVFYSMISVFMLGTFFIKYRVELILVIPVMCALFCYYLAISFKEDSSVQRPEKLYKEKCLLSLCLVFICVFIFCMRVDLPALHQLLSTALISIN